MEVQGVWPSGNVEIGLSLVDFILVAVAHPWQNRQTQAKPSPSPAAPQTTEWLLASFANDYFLCLTVENKRDVLTSNPLGASL